ncbi:SAGA-associated factor 11 homolog 1-like [Drosophila tropicalis]|uniref:SAGA-associated factor 11 homolog 1-like n=1 Tax=Drosophila tropicalis TaxID=46794 RepID=UPI0035ABE02A
MKHDQDELPSGSIEAKATNQIISDFRALIKDPGKLNEAVNYLYETLVDDAAVGIFMETRHLQKNGNLRALEGTVEESNDMCDLPEFDIFGMSTAEKTAKCCCPNCDRMVAAVRFAPHLQTCLGLGRSASRTALRRLTTSSRSSSTSTGGGQANEKSTDDEDWSLDTRHGKSTKSSRNKKNK